MGCSFFSVQTVQEVSVLQLCSDDPTNRLTRACVLGLNDVLREMAPLLHPLVIAGNNRFLSAGAELREIASLDGPSAFEFARMGQDLMVAIERFPAPVYAAISGYCMGGGLDLALACHHRIASPHAVFGHRGAALGLITGWAEPSDCLDWSAKRARSKCSSPRRRSPRNRPCASD